MRPALLLTLLLAPVRTSAADPVCPGVAFEGEAVELEEAELRLVCGDPESEAWRRVPPAQAERFLAAFLQQRGRHSPSFDLREGTLYVDPGPVTLIGSLGGRGLPPAIDLGKKRRIVGKPMTPRMLNKVRALLVSELQNHGYACPKVEMSADARTGEVLGTLTGGSVHVLERVEPPRLERVDPEIFRRYEAFKAGKPIDQRLFKLSSDRIVAEALFLSSRYEVSCGTGGVRVAHLVAAAPPRLIRIGVGVDTEGLTRLRARWNHSRIGYRASSLAAVLLASRREQSLEGLMRWFLHPASRLHLAPRAILARAYEPRFETVSSELSLMPAFGWDDQSLRLDVSAGPALRHVDTRRGIGPVNARFLTFNSRVAVTSHLFEYYLREPQRGFRADLETASRVSEVDSALTAHRLRLSAEALWNLGSYDPPVAVLGARGWAGTTLVRDPEGALRELPPDFRFFLGGDSDFRGVGRGELGDESGFYTALYHGLELRAGDLLPYRLQPFVFLDAAMAGRRPRRLDPDVHYAPGLGLRWATPVGAFRTTLARGLLWKRDEATQPRDPRWKFFFSYGREF